MGKCLNFRLPFRNLVRRMKDVKLACDDDALVNDAEHEEKSCIV